MAQISYIEVWGMKCRNYCRSCEIGWVMESWVARWLHFLQAIKLNVEYYIKIDSTCTFLCLGVLFHAWAAHCLVKWCLNNRWQGFVNESSVPNQLVNVIRKMLLNCTF